MTQCSSLLRSLATSSAFSFLLTPTVSATEQTVEMPSVNVCAWILIDYASDKVLAGDNAGEKLDPASLTEVMTSYVAGRILETDKIKLTGMVTVGKDAWATGDPTLHGSSVMFPKPNDQVLVADLNKGVIIQSGNSACITLTDHVAGNQEPFTDLVNSCTKKSGLTNTTFQMVHNPDTPGQFSIVRNMALLDKTLIHDMSEKYIIHKKREFTFNKIHQPNRGHPLWSSDLNVDDTKTGTTVSMGYNLATSATRDDMHLISVMLGAKTDRIRFNESEKLLTWGFRFFETVASIKPNAIFVAQRVWFGDKGEVDLGVGEASSATIPCRQLKGLKASYTLTKPQLTVPLEKGQIVDAIDFQLGGRSIEQRSLVVMESAGEGGFFGRMRDFVTVKFHQWFDSWFS